MLFCKTFVQKRIAKRSRERNVDDATQVHMPDFSFMESIFSGSKAVRVNRDVWPSGDFPFDALQSSVHLQASPFVRATHFIFSAALAPALFLRGRRIPD
jgi:hypothetical protein